MPLSHHARRSLLLLSTASLLGSAPLLAASERSSSKPPHSTAAATGKATSHKHTPQSPATGALKPGKSSKTASAAQTAPSRTAHKATNTPATAPSQPPFSDDSQVQAFIERLVQEQGFERSELQRWFRQIHPNATVLKAITPAATAERRSWERYRERFVNERRIQRGLTFWNENEGTLRRARAMYGVPEELIIALLGVETEYGRNTGRFSVLEALSTLAFRYPPRADFFRSELEHFLLLTRDNRLDPLTVRGSYAGAIGIPQFMPGSERRYAVDFDQDGRIDLAGSVADAIGSVAAYINAHGWVPNAPVALPLRLDQAPPEAVAAQVAAGIKPSLGGDALRQLGNVGAPERRPEQPWAMIDLASPGSDTEYWQGFHNFFVISRYNRSSFYAMAVFQLSEALREGHGR